MKENTVATSGREPDELCGYLFSLTYAVSSCGSVNKDMAPISCKEAKRDETLEHSTNIFIACFART